jgi:hypothetical protein
LKSSGRKTLERLIQVVTVRDTPPIVDVGASTAPDHVDDFPNDVSKLSVVAVGSRLAIHGNLVFAGTVLAAAAIGTASGLIYGLRPIPSRIDQPVLRGTLS